MLHRLAFHLKRYRSRASRSYVTLNWIELSKSALMHNVAAIRRQHPGSTGIPVLKSNAYGHGLTEIAEMLNAAECDLLAVDGYFEAARIRYITRHRILVLGYIKPENAHLLDVKKCSFVVQDTAGLVALGKLNRTVHIHLEINTGMNRLGILPNEVDGHLKTLKKYPKLRLEGVLSHLADADNPTDTSFTERQVVQFDECVATILAQGFTPRYIHIAQTAGSPKVKSRYANAIRLGIGLYGINPLVSHDPQAPLLRELRPILSLKSTIIKEINLKKGDRVSYNGIFEAKHAMRVGVLPLGYYEGLPRTLSNTGILTAGGHTLPILGRVCMNHTMLDISDTDLSVGDQVTVIAAEPQAPNSVIRLAQDHNLFTYGIVMGLSNTIRRKVVA